jgi:hypothetical protein
MENDALPKDAQPIERRLATILMADVADYSRMMGEDEERTVEAAPKVETADNKAVDRFDGMYAGRMCSVNRDGSPRCWGVGLTVQHGTLSAAWPSSFSTELARAKGTISPEGAVDLVLAGFNPKNGGPLPGSLGGRWANNAITASGAWSNGAPINVTWTRAL